VIHEEFHCVRSMRIMKGKDGHAKNMIHPFQLSIIATTNGNDS
jgi:hypothetical protein